jgi:hypothetical protein
LASTVPGGAETVDEKHPRAPDQPLNIQVTPWYCPLCLKQELIAGEPRSIELMRDPAAIMAEKLGVRRNWVVIESPHFRIFSTLKGARIKHSDSTFAAADLLRLKEVFPSFKVGCGGTYVNAHQRAHLYHVRLERQYAHFSALTANTKKWLGMLRPYEVYLFEKDKPYGVFRQQILGRANVEEQVAFEHITGKKNFLVFGTCARFHKAGDRQLNNRVMHMVSHMLVNGLNNFYSDIWAWLEEGFGHFYERRESEVHNHFCLGFGRVPAEWERGNWRKKIRHAVYRKKERPLSLWCEKLQPQELTEWERALAWSYVDWLMKADPVRLAKLLEMGSRSGERTQAADAISEVFGVTPHVLHDRWRNYVLGHLSG